MPRFYRIFVFLSLFTTPLSAFVLDYPTALQRVFSNSSAIELAEIDTNISEARLLQAGAGLNPILSIDFGADQFWNGGGVGGEISPGISQEFEIGGKRKKRREVANADLGKAIWQAEQVKMETLHSFTEAFIEVAIDQELIKIAQEKQKSAKQSVDYFKELVAEGKGFPLDQYKANLALTSVSLDLKTALQHLESRKRKLAAFWGASQPDFEEVAWPIEKMTPVPPLDKMLQRLDKRPDVLAAKYATHSAFAAWELEKSMAIPNVTVSAGFTWAQECHDNSLFLGLSIPLPIFDQNCGNISRAAYEAIRKEQEEEALLQSLRNGLETAYLEYEKACQEVITIKEELLTAAEEALKWAEEGYQAGKISLPDVLDMRKERLDQEERYYNALLDYHSKRINVIMYINAD